MEQKCPLVTVFMSEPSHKKFSLVYQMHRIPPDFNATVLLALPHSLRLYAHEDPPRDPAKYSAIFAE